MEKKNYKKIGILGGTFDPPHKGHLYISKIALKKLKLNKILWVITKKNPLKKNPFLDIKKRINLSKKLVFKEKKIFVSYFDNKVRSNKTFNILNYIIKKKKRQKIYLLIGADNLVQFHKWYNWKKIPTLAKIVIFARENHSMNKVRQIASKRLKRNDWIYINSKKIKISSSLIRKFW